MRLGKRLKRGAIYYLAKAMIAILNVVSRRVSQVMGAWIGLIVWKFAGRGRYRINRHLLMVYGDRLKTTDRTLIGREFFINSGKNLTDVVRFQRHLDDLKSLVTVEGLEHYHAAFARGKGMLGITGHIGNFELMAAYLGAVGYPIAVIGREMYDRRMDRLLIANREAVGLTNFSTNESPRTLLRWLARNGGIGVLIDTDSHRVRGDFVNWFGQPAYTPIGQAFLGLRAGAAFVPMACIRTEGDRYKIIIRPAVSITPTGDKAVDARAVTQACVWELEAIIDKYRSQWIWLHNRWHTRPEKTA